MFWAPCCLLLFTGTFRSLFVHGRPCSRTVPGDLFQLFCQDCLKLLWSFACGSRHLWPFSSGICPLVNNLLGIAFGLLFFKVYEKAVRAVCALLERLKKREADSMQRENQGPAGEAGKKLSSLPPPFCQNSDDLEQPYDGRRSLSSPVRSEKGLDGIW